jgi:hypothetical protein
VTIFGVDVSHHQGGNIDFAALWRDGIEFAFLKATEGASFVDPRFITNLRRARAAGLLVAAYHYVRGGASVATQVNNVRRTVPRDVPVLLDVEEGSGDVGLTRQLVAGLRVSGYRVPLLYIPRWYHRQLGSPSLAGLPPLWSSRYPDGTVGELRDEFARVPPHYWTGYGGLKVAVLQFTSSARVAGYRPLDANAFRGTRGQLAELLGSTREVAVRNLVLARESETAEAVWVGDGVRRRHVADVRELEGLQHWIAQEGGNGTVRVVADLRVLGEVDPTAVPVELDYVRFVADVVRQLADALETRGLATTEGVADVVREVFRDAGTADEPVPPTGAPAE